METRPPEKLVMYSIQIPTFCGQLYLPFQGCLDTVLYYGRNPSPRPQELCATPCRSDTVFFPHFSPTSADSSDSRRGHTAAVWDSQIPSDNRDMSDRT